MASQSLRHGAGAAHGEKIGDGGHQYRDGAGHGHRRRLSGIVQETYKIGICQIIRQQNHLTGDGGQDLPQHRPGNRHLLKQVSFVLRSLHPESLLYTEFYRSLYPCRERKTRRRFFAGKIYLHLRE